MMKNGIKSFIRTVALVGGLLLTTSSDVNSVSGMPTEHIMISTSEAKVVAKVVEKKTKLHAKELVSKAINYAKEGNFLGGFKLYTKVDTTLTPKFKDALSDYRGPGVKVNSLRRHFNKHSDHFSGNAADFEFSNEMIQYLVSEDGQNWLVAWNLYFFIEGRPGSRKVAKYLSDPITKPYVFFNKSATGNHIHLGMR